MAAREGQVALVTGAARGIGAAVARRFAQAGARVGVLDLDEAATGETVAAIRDGGGAALAIRDGGGAALAIGADVSDPDQVDAAVERLAKEFGGLHIAVNNAGVTRDNLLFKMTTDDRHTVMRVHLRGAFLATKAAQRIMVGARYGRVINLSSTAATGNRGQASYSAAKAGLQGFTKTAAIELGPFGITVNAIGPGYVGNAMTRATAERLGIPIEERLASGAQTLPVRRVGQPEGISGAALFLASPDSGYITGQVLYVDGGRLLR